jgi:DHA1 family multidrug resistance protein-like MFS transporter
VRNRRLGLASGLALAYSLALLGDQMLYVFLPSQPAAAGVAAASLGIILSANRFVRLAANSLAGLLSDRLGRRRPYLLGMLLALLSTAGYLVSDGFWPLLLSRVVWGIAFALLHVVGAAIILDVTTDEDRGRTVGAYSSLAQFGTLVGLVLSGFLTDLVGYRGTLMVYVPLAALGIVVAFVVLRDHDAGPMRRAAPAGGLGTLATLRRLDPRLLAPAYVNFVSLFAGSGVVAATLGVYLKQLAAEPGASLLVPVASLTGILLASRRLAGMIEAPIAGQLLDRFGNRRAVAALGALASLVGFAVLAGGRGVGMVVLGVVLMAIGEGFIGPAVVVWTGDNAPPHLRGVVMGGLATSGDLGAAIGPLVGYALLETAGLRSAYALCVALMVSALLVLAFVRGYAGSRPGPTPTRSLI